MLPPGRSIEIRVRVDTVLDAAPVVVEVRLLVIRLAEREIGELVATARVGRQAAVTMQHVVLERRAGDDVGIVEGDLLGWVRLLSPTMYKGGTQLDVIQRKMSNRPYEAIQVLCNVRFP